MRPAVSVLQCNANACIVLTSVGKRDERGFMKDRLELHACTYAHTYLRSI